MTIPVPSNEDARLAELASLRIPFEDPLQELQALCEVAARIAGTPVALVSLVLEDEQRFAANIGLEGVTGTPRSVAFCAHAIMGDDLLVVTDANRDERFASNPLVTGEPGIRAYAGAPLNTDADLRVGTLCVIDFEPRPFTPEQIADLEKLGHAAAGILNAHRAKLDLAGELAKAKEREVQLRHAARHDGLTGLLNAKTFREAAADAIARSYEAVPMALVLVDVDHFKTVNDRYGHALGDAYLRGFAAALRDNSPDDALIGRLGGDEFAVLLTGFGQHDHTTDEIIGRWRDGLKNLARTMARNELGRASIGVAFTPDHAQMLEPLYQFADVALYASKENGRNRTTHYSEALCSMHNMRSFRTEILSALDRNEIVPFYQPKVDLRTNEMTGLEVLCRWHHPTRGILKATDYAVAFRDQSISPHITRAMFQKAVDDFARWGRAGLFAGRLSINATVYDLSDPSFAPEIDAMLRDVGIAWQRITIEVTETVVMGEQGDQVYLSLEDLRGRGAHIALDDFGTGYGGLQHFRSWPIDVVKLDRSFVAQLPDAPRDKRIVRAIVELARDFGLRVVAEGIETEAQYEALKAMGCQTGQGFFLGEPMSAQKAEAYLRSKAERRSA